MRGTKAPKMRSVSEFDGWVPNGSTLCTAAVGWGQIRQMPSSRTREMSFLSDPLSGSMLREPWCNKAISGSPQFRIIPFELGIR